jgi:competence transcription factor ComK
MPVAKLDSLKPQQVVKPATDVMAEKLSKALRMDVNKGTAFRVLAIVEKGTDYLGRSASGLIVEPVTAPGAFPFVFSADTFRVPAEE